MLKTYLHILTGLLLITSSCGGNDNSGKFELQSPSETGIDFTNLIPENDTLNQFTYGYIYNGNGTATVDLDNDGLPEVVVTGNSTASKIYKNNGDFKFTDISAQSGFTPKGWCTGIAVADVNSDGLLDIYVCRSGPTKDTANLRNYLYINKGNLKFEESAAQFGVDNTGNTTTATFFDMDNDGDLDLFVGNHNYEFFNDVDVPFTPTMHLTPLSQQYLYKNDNGHFTDISQAAGIAYTGFCLGLTAADFNKDGLIDIYVNNDYFVPDYYFVNKGNGKFEESHRTYFKHCSANAMGADIADLNKDGFTDYFQVDMLNENPRRFMQMLGPKEYKYFKVALNNNYGHQYMKNTLQINQGNGYFSDIAHLAGIARTDWSWSPLFGDFDNDGYKDLFISNGYYRDVTNLDFVFYTHLKARNENKGVSTKEILEKLPHEKILNYCYKGGENLTFTNYTLDWGLEELTLSSGASYSDLDGDGDLDLVLCNQGEQMHIYKNNIKQGNYLKIALKGKTNTYGFGAKVFIKTKTGNELIEINSQHGYQSCTQPIAYVGLGQEIEVPEIKVVWPGGNTQTLKNVKANTQIEFKETDANSQFVFADLQAKTFDNTSNLGISFKHSEMDNPDFERDKLLPHRYTRLGPGCAVGDVNGDGLYDVFIANARESSGATLFLQNTVGTFNASPSQPWVNMRNVDMMGVLFFDADNDGDLDLYCAAGGSEYAVPSPYYKHHIYANDGKGNFVDKTDALPADLNMSASCVTAGDYDGDGDLDLFVGGRVVPGQYPLMNVRSYLLQNNNGIFKDVTQAASEGLQKPGWVTCASFVDFNNDNKLDLILSGEYLPLVYLQNNGNGFDNITGNMGTNSLFGWFNSVYPVDIDNDGDFDLIAGNKGDNSFMKASTESPLTMYYADLDDNGRLDLWFTYVFQGAEFPVYQIDEMNEAYPSFLRQRFKTYGEMSNLTASALFGEENMNKGKTFANEFSSLLVTNNDNIFSSTDLPKMAQSAPIYGIDAQDIDQDGYMDILLVGNSESPRVTYGRDDAFYGAMLKNTKGKLQFQSGVANGFNVPGDAKSLVNLPVKDKMVWIANQNNDNTVVISKKTNATFIPAQALEHKAMVEFTNGQKQVIFVGYGAGFLSQNARGVWKNSNIKNITFYNSQGKARIVQ